MRKIFTIIALTFMYSFTMGQNVGISNNLSFNPLAKLHVSGGGQILGTNGTHTNTRTLTLLNDGTTQLNYGSYPGAWTSALLIQNNDNTNFVWLSPLQNTTNARLRIGGAGIDLYVGGGISDEGVFASRFENNGSIGYLNLGSITNNGSASDPSVNQGSNAITWGYRSDNMPYYNIRTQYKTYGSYTFSRLQFNWHTGIEMGASSTYGGTRFFNNSPGVGATQIMSIGDGDNHVRINNHLFTQYINSTDNIVNSGVSGIMVKTGDNYFRTGNATAIASFLNGTISPDYANLTGIPLRNNWNGIHRNFVAEQLSWKNYGNSHTIFDASQSTSPQGTAINNTNPTYNWTATYPTLMGWNGSSTYGVRVDVARYAESAPGDNLGNHVATTTLNMNGNVINNFRRIEPLGIGGNSGEGNNAYAIFQEGGPWSYPYPDLRIAYHTGIKFGANSSYNGMRFYNDYDMSTLVLAVNDVSTSGNNNVYIPYSLGIATTPSAPLDVRGAGLAGEGTYRVKFGWYNGTEPVVNPTTANWGYVGTPAEYWYQMYARSYYAANGYYYFSDNSLKNNVRVVTDALNKVTSLRGVTYDIVEGTNIWNDKDIDENYGQIGFIAQEVQKIIPNIVRKVDMYSTHEHVKNDQDNLLGEMLTIDYVRIIPLLVEAIKEQQKIIEDLQFQINNINQ